MKRSINFSGKIIGILIAIFCFFLAISLLLFGMGDFITDSPTVAHATWGDETNMFDLSFTFQYDSTVDYYEFIVPYNGVYSLECYGAQGGDIGSATGGRGGYVQANGYFTAGTKLYVHVGEQGGAGGSTKDGGGGAADPNCAHMTPQNQTSGGGSTDIRYNANEISDRIMVGAGGGGASRSQTITVGGGESYHYANGGNGGGNHSYSEGWGTDQKGYGFDGASGEVSASGTYYFSNTSIGIAGEGATREGGNALFYGESTNHIGASDSSCWCEYSGSRVYVYSGGGLGAGGGGYYGGKSGTASHTSGYYSDGTTNYQYTVQSGDSSYTDYEQSYCAAGGGGGSSFISGFYKSGVKICDIINGYSFLNDGQSYLTTIGQAQGGCRSGNGLARITFVRMYDSMTEGDDVQCMPVVTEGWYKIEADGPKVSGTNGSIITGYVYATAGKIFCAKIGVDNVTEFRINDYSRTDFDHYKFIKRKSDTGTTNQNTFETAALTEITDEYNVAYKTIVSGGGGQSGSNYISGGQGYGVNGEYVVYGSSVLNVSSTSANIKLTLLRDGDMPEADQKIIDRVSVNEEVKGNSGADFSQTVVVPEDGRYTLRAWGNTATAYGTIWLKEDTEIEVVFDYQEESRTDVTVSIGDVEFLSVTNNVPTANGGVISSDGMKMTGTGTKTGLSNSYPFFLLFLQKRDMDAPSGLSIVPDREGKTVAGDTLGVSGYYYNSVTFTFYARDLDSETSAADSGVTHFKYRVNTGSDVGDYLTQDCEYDDGYYKTEIEVVCAEEQGLFVYTVEMEAWDFVGLHSSKSYSIAFYRTLNNLVIYDGTGASEERQYHIESDNIVLNDLVPSIDGYDFTGWYQLENGNFLNTRVEVIRPENFIHGVSVYADYTLNDVTVSQANAEFTAIYNEGESTQITGPEHSHAAPGDKVYTYAWRYKESVSDPYGNDLGKNTSSLILTWGDSVYYYPPKAGEYWFVVDISARTYLTYTAGLTKVFYTSAATRSGEYHLTVNKKNFSNAEIVALNATESHVYTGAYIIQESLILTDKNVVISSDFYDVDYLNNRDASNEARGSLAHVTITATEGNDFYTGSISETFLIIPKPLSEVSIAKYGPVIYSGSRYEPKPEVSWKRGDVKVTLTEDTDFVYSWGPQGSNVNAAEENAGIIIITAIANDSQFSCNYSGSKTVYFDIDRKPVTIDTSGMNLTDYVYIKDTEQTVYGGAVLDDPNSDQVIKYSNNTFTTVEQGNNLRVKVYVDATLNYAAAETYVSITVAKAVPVINTDSVRKEFTYDGSEQSINKSATTDGESLIKYDIDLDGVLYDNTNKFKDVPLYNKEVDGETKYYYTLVLSMEESPNYTEFEERVDIFVEKAEFTVILSSDNYDFTYDGVAHEITGFFTIVRGADEYEDIVYSDNVITNRSENGKHTVYGTISEVRNYKEKTVSMEITVSQATPDLSVIGVGTTYTYNFGNDITVNSGATVTLCKEEDADTVEISYADNTFNVVGNYVMTVTVSNADGHYNYATVTKPVNVRVNKYSLSVPSLSVRATYGQPLKDVTHASFSGNATNGFHTGDGEHEGIAVTVQGNTYYVPGTYVVISEDYNQEASTPLGTVAGPVTTLKSTFVPDDEDNFYTVYDIGISITVGRATRTIYVSNIPTVYTYTGQVQYFSGADIDDSEGRMSITYSPESFLTVNDIMDGNRTLTVTVPQTANYLYAEAYVEITVNKAQETINVDGIESFVYTGTEYSVNSGASLYNSEQRNAIVYSFNAFTTYAEAMDTEVTISAPETDNYEATSVIYVPRMEKAIPYFDHSAVNKSFTYTGSVQTVSGEVRLYNAHVLVNGEYTMPDDEQTAYFDEDTNKFVTVPQGNALEVTVRANESANYKEGSARFRITVAKAIPETHAQSVEVTYGSRLDQASNLEPGYTFIDGSVGVGTVKNPATGLTVMYAPFGDDSYNYEMVYDIPLTVTVLKADPGLSVTGVKSEYVYNGQLQTVNSGATAKSGVIIRYDNNTFTTVAEGNNMKVRVYVYVKDDGTDEENENENYNPVEKFVQITVRRASPIFDMSGMPTTYVYNGAEQVIEGVTVNNEEQTIRYSLNKFTTVEAGRAIEKVTVSVTQSANYLAYSVDVPITVNKATQVIDTAAAEAGFVYNGETQYVTASIPDAEQTLNSTRNSFVTVEEGDGLSITFYALESANYNYVSKTVVISVAKRIPETSPQTVEAFYGQNLNDIKNKLQFGYGFEQYLVTSVGTPDEPAVVSLKYDSGNANEEVIPGIECTLVVLPREITITANDVSVVYGDDGYVNAELTYRLSRNAIVGSDELNVVLSREEGVTPGDYAINLSYNNELYNATLVPGTYRIEKRTVYVTADVYESYYGEEVPVLNYTLTGGTMYNGEQLSGTLGFEFTPYLAGKYTIINDVTGTNDYYNVILSDDEFTVLPRPISVYAKTISAVYGVKPEFDYTVEKRGGSLTGNAMIGSDVFSGEMYLETGDVGRRRILSGLYNSNYDIEFVSAYCNVTPAPVTIKADPAESIYGDPVNFTYTVVEGAILEGDDPGAVLTQSEKDVGEHDIMGTFTNANYNVTFVSDKHTITPKRVTVKISDQEKTRLTYIADPSVDNKRYAVIAGEVFEDDDLLVVITKSEGSDIGEYDLTAVSNNENYEVTMMKGVFTITKDPSTIIVDESSLNVVYDGKTHQVSARVTSSATPEYYYKGEQKEDVLKAAGSYLIRITALATELYFAPEPVEVTLTINQAELADESTGVTILSAGGGFAPDEKLVIDSTLTEWNEEEYGELPENYGITESYIIKKVNGEKEESSLEGEITVQIKLSGRFKAGEKVSLALVCDGETVITEAEVAEDGTVTVTGTNLTRVAVIEKQNGLSLAVILIIVGAAVLLLFIFIMVKAGLSKKG